MQLDLTEQAEGLSVSVSSMHHNNNIISSDHKSPLHEKVTNTNPIRALDSSSSSSSSPIISQTFSSLGKHKTLQGSSAGLSSKLASVGMGKKTVKQMQAQNPFSSSSLSSSSSSINDYTHRYQIPSKYESSGSSPVLYNGLSRFPNPVVNNASSGSLPRGPVMKNGSSSSNYYPGTS
ncbi:unnamed protein product, partial [Allacma fusca]